MKRILFLNGPPRCGKDTVVSHLTPYFQFGHVKFADPIKDAVAGMLGITRKELEEIKDTRHPILVRRDTVLMQDTLRQLLIPMSEDLMKPRYGDDIFGRIFWLRAKQRHEHIVIASDCGFEDEVRPVIERNGKGTCTLIRIHRPGFTFDNDSRGYLRDGLCKTYDITNDLTIHDLTMRVLNVIMKEWAEYVTLLREPQWIK